MSRGERWGMRPFADTKELMTAVESMPLFPLPGTVFIPHTLLPLHVFEPRYRDLVDDAMRASGVTSDGSAPSWSAIRSTTS